MPQDKPIGITEQLHDWSDERSSDAAEALLNLVYAELHRRAHRYLQRTHRTHGQPRWCTAYLKLSNKSRSLGKAAVFAIAATLVADPGRSPDQDTGSSGGPQEICTSKQVHARRERHQLRSHPTRRSFDRLAEKDPDLARIVELRF